MGAALHNWILRNWYGGGQAYWLLLPLTGLYWIAITLRRLLYRVGIFHTTTLDVPVIVIGNITAGGTGKTPVAAWLASELVALGFRPGIVSRGYGGSGSSGTPVSVDDTSDPAVVGDEAVLLARRAGCPVVVGADRVAAARRLIASGVDIVIADDGLQHLALGRDYEICVIDGERWLGNGMLLPAGPLRESKTRLAEVDQVVINGASPGMDGADALQCAVEFRLEPECARRLDGSSERPLAAFAGHTVHAVAAIGNPQRFFAMLRRFGLQLIEHPLPDHAALSIRDVSFDDDNDILMTEKDAVKLGAARDERLWYVPVSLHMEKPIARPWLAQVVSRLRQGLEPT